jgi:hypothetical protein
MERRIIYFPENTATMVLDAPERCVPRIRDQELAALTQAIRKAEAAAANFLN